MTGGGSDEDILGWCLRHHTSDISLITTRILTGYLFIKYKAKKKLNKYSKNKLNFKYF